MADQLLYTARAGFESALQIPLLDGQHPASRLHGHSFISRIRSRLPSSWRQQDEPELHLQNALEQCVSQLDYDLLNNHLDNPTDENLARWIREHLELPEIELIGVQSTAREGADLDAEGNAHIWQRYRFEAAHYLPNVPPGHQCGRMHGHGFEVILHVKQAIGSSDMGLDYNELNRCWMPIYQQLDHACLNDIEGLDNPTSEAIAAWIWQRLKPRIEALSWVTVFETSTAGCHYDGYHYRIWKEMRFESALSLNAVEPSQPRRLIGHSYLLRLHLSAALDPVMNWTVDYGDVKTLFKPVYQRLDHHLLDELDQLPDASLENLVHWIKGQSQADLPMLDRIDLMQTPGCGVILNWGEQGPVIPV